MRRNTPRIVPHHFKPRVCLRLLPQCCAFRKAERVPRRVGTSCWSSGQSKSATFAFSRGNALFHVFAFVCPSHKGAGEAATKGARHEVLHQILWRDKSGSHQLFFSLLFSLTADVCVGLGPVEAPPSFASSFCVEKQCSTRLFSTVAFSSCPPHSSGHQCL